MRHANHPFLVSKSPEDKLRALCALSNFGEHIDVSRFTRVIAKAPDPETAAEVVLETFDIPSDVLRRKWRSAVMEVWSDQHPHVPLLPGLAVASSDVVSTPLLRDVRSYLDELSEKPANLVKEQGEILVAAEDVWRLAAALPSQTTQAPLQIENEWGIVPLRRLRQVLQALRLVRVYKGQLVVVNSRFERFLSLPLTQQFYILWHADTYHIDWSQFAGMWGPYMHVVQEYLPLLWDMSEHISSGTVMQRPQFIAQLLDLYTPLWDDEGLFDVGSGSAAVLPVLQHHALPTIVDAFILRDLLSRHGLIELGDTFGTLTQMTWTKAGAAILQAEMSHDLPCARTLLDSK